MEVDGIGMDALASSRGGRSPRLSARFSLGVKNECAGALRDS